jgi:hypothetical protein
MNVDLKITGRIESLHLEPGDTVVATVEGRLTSAQGKAMRDALLEKFPGHDAIVVSDGTTISKVTT